MLAFHKLLQAIGEHRSGATGGWYWAVIATGVWSGTWLPTLAPLFTLTAAYFAIWLGERIDRALAMVVVIIFGGPAGIPERKRCG